MYYMRFVYSLSNKAIPENFVENLEYFKKLGGKFNEENKDKDIVIKDLCIGCRKYECHLS